MSVTNLVRYGTTERPDWAKARARKDAFAQRRYVNRQNAEARKREREALPLIQFQPEEFARLTKAARAGLGGEREAGGLWAILTIESFKQGATICMHIRPETAARFAKWMRHPDVNAYGHALAQMDAASGATAPTGTAIRMAHSDFQAILAKLDGMAGDILDATDAVKFLRKARFERGLIYVYVTQNQAARLSDVFMGAGIERGLILQLDRIAGRETAAVTTPQVVA